MPNKKQKPRSGKFLGMPMNWDRKNIFKNSWNKDTTEIVLPKTFGIGWTLNFHALLSKAGLLKKNQRNQD